MMKITTSRLDRSLRIACLVALGAAALGAGSRPASPPPPPPSAPATPTAPPAAPDPKPDTKPDTKPETKKYPELIAVIETSRGTMKAKLAVNELPKLVAHFTNLAGRKFYDGLTFHAVSKNTQIHSGDPTGTGDGGCGYKLANQFHKNVFFDRSGVLGLWSVDGKPSSQFFITLMPMGKKYNLREAGIGHVFEGLEVGDTIVKGDTVTSVRIEGDQEKLRADFKQELAEWNAVLDAQKSR